MRMPRWPVISSMWTAFVLTPLKEALYARQPERNALVIIAATVRNTCRYSTVSALQKPASRRLRAKGGQLRHSVYDELERLPNLTRATIGRMPLR